MGKAVKVYICIMASFMFLFCASLGLTADNDNNPPGPRGGQGTNWENPPGPKGGPGASPDQKPEVGYVDQGLEEKAKVNEKWEKEADTNNDGIVDKYEIHQWKKKHKTSSSTADAEQVNTKWENKADTNNDGVVDQAEITQWEKTHPKNIGARSKVNRPWEQAADANNDGKVDQTEINQWRSKDKDNNPPGTKGGPGTNWENPPGQAGGPGASPDRRPRKVK